jgi:hypothetical protein
MGRSPQNALMPSSGGTVHSRLLPPPVFITMAMSLGSLFRFRMAMMVFLIWAGIVEDPTNPRMASKVSLKCCHQPPKALCNRPTYFASSSHMLLNDHSTLQAGKQVESCRAHQPPLEYAELSYHSISAPEGSVVPQAFITAKNSSS